MPEEVNKVQNAISILFEIVTKAQEDIQEQIKTQAQEDIQEQIKTQAQEDIQEKIEAEAQENIQEKIEAQAQKDIQEKIEKHVLTIMGELNTYYKTDQPPVYKYTAEIQQLKDYLAALSGVGGDDVSQEVCKFIQKSCTALETLKFKIGTVGQWSQEFMVKMLIKELSALNSIRTIVRLRHQHDSNIADNVKNQVKKQIVQYVRSCTGDEVERYRTLNALCESWPVQYGSGKDNLTNDYGLPWLKKMLEEIAETVRSKYTPPSYSESLTNSCKGHSNTAKKTVAGIETVKFDGFDERQKEGLGNDLSGLRAGDIKPPVFPYFLLPKGGKENNKRNNHKRNNHKRNNHNPEEKPLLGI